MGVCEEALQCHVERLFWSSGWHGCAVLGDRDEVGWMEMIPGDSTGSGCGSGTITHLQRGTSSVPASNLTVQEWQTAVTRE